MVEVRTPIQIGEAVEKVMSFARFGEAEEVKLEQAYGRYLSEDLIADHDVPHFDRSGYDGFAICSKDSLTASRSNPVVFEVIEEIGAGYVVTKEVKPFQAVRIMTGAQMPDHCDTVVLLELTKEFEKSGKKYISIERSFQAGDNVSFRGEDVKKGNVLVPRGTYINPGVQALLATFGYHQVEVVKKPLIGIYATGTELLDVNEELQPGKIRNSNAHMVHAQIERVGAIPDYFGKLADNFEDCYKAISNAINEVDILITTGGVSVGDFDYLPAIYEKLGARVLFNKIAMRPGSVTTVAELNGKLLFGLSGNPSACYVGFELFVRPIVNTLFGSKKPHLKKVRANLQADVATSNAFTRFVRSYLSFSEKGLQVEPVGFDKSSMVSTLARANSLMVLPGGPTGFKEGAVVDVLLLEDVEGSEWPW
ncbi:molybdopterin molybdotransferase MoeA [Neobacillus bataviensis]|uniref:molybdopterin molybdotransferase MoeA n=1 Tax=Neobacillus bataviensis TaxID=220685 RepID=UPI001CBCE67E|nr:gephyrin-like molybdotransferase Glp [Neobacillus bataviensis]